MAALQSSRLSKSRRQTIEYLDDCLRRVEDVLAEGRYTDLEDIANYTAHAKSLRSRLARMQAGG